MEGELKTIIKVSLMVAASMAYARLVSTHILPGKRRLIALLPVLSVLPSLPFLFSTINLRGTSAFFLAWLGLFKILLLAFGLGPLSPSLPLLPFIATASLPVKLKPPTKSQPTSSSRRLLLSSIFRALLLAAFLPLYGLFSLHAHPYLLLVFYCALIYLTLEFNLALAASIASLMDLALEPQFNSPLRSSSLQDFWGRRWNLMVTTILRPSVYLPVSNLYGQAAGVMATFIVSGIMHEVMFYYITLSAPTGEVTVFFVIHGVCTAVEGVMMRRRWWPRSVAVPVAVGLLVVTLTWLFFPPLMRNGTDKRAMQEFMEVLRLLENGVQGFVDRLGFGSEILVS